MTVPGYVFAEEGDLIITACPEETLGGCWKEESHCTSSKKRSTTLFCFSIYSLLGISSFCCRINVFK